MMVKPLVFLRSQTEMWLSGGFAMFFLSAAQTWSSLGEPQQTFPPAVPFTIPVLERLSLPEGELEDALLVLWVFFHLQTPAPASWSR